MKAHNSYLASTCGVSSAAEALPEVSRLHFCGEHLATATRGMEGAMESAEEAAAAGAAALALFAAYMPAMYVPGRSAGFV